MRVFISKSSLALTALVLACSDAVTPSASGSLRVAATTTGTPPDADGYLVRVDQNSNGPDPRVAVNGSVMLPDLPTGSHRVRLLDIAVNCTVTEPNPGTVTVEANATAQIGFTVTCSSGSLAITTETSGSALDPDGYSVSVDAGPAQPIGINASLTLSDIAPGPHTVELAGLAANCSVTEANPGTVTVVANATAPVSFTVTCVSGGIEITTETSGSALDPDGYTLRLDAGAVHPIGINASLTLSDIASGPHTVELAGLAANCTVTESNPGAVTVVANATAQIGFTVTCSVGSITITTETTGDAPDPDGYAVSVDGGPAQLIGINASVTLSDVATGQHTVELSGLAYDCRVSGNPRAVTVVANVPAQISFTVTCNRGARIRVTVSTTGANIPGSFIVFFLDLPLYFLEISPNGSRTSQQLPVGSHTVSLSVAPNCSVNGPRRQTVTVQNGVTTQVNFSAVCS